MHYRGAAQERPRRPAARPALVGGHGGPVRHRRRHRHRAAFEFGLLWPGLMGTWGDVFGIGFGVEAWAFFLEAVLIAIYLYGWRRLKPADPLPARPAAPAGRPAGRVRHPGRQRLDEHAAGLHPRRRRQPVDVNVGKAIFTPMFGPQYWHFVVAAFMTAGLHGRRRLRGRLAARPPRPLPPARLPVPFTVAAILTPVQFVLGDSIARSVFHKQPVKFAAIEIVWKTDQPVPSTSSGGCNRTGPSPAASRSPDSTRSWPASAADTVVRA